MAVAAGIFQVADVAIPAVVAGATTARRNLRAGVIVRQDIRVAVVLPARKAIPEAAEVMADRAIPAGAATTAGAAIMAGAATTAGAGRTVVGT